MAKATSPNDWMSRKSHNEKERPSGRGNGAKYSTPDDVKLFDIQKWICMYPAYINSKKTLAEGRRIPVNKAVDNPNVQEIRDVLSASGLVVGVENKAYSREKSHEPLSRGRIRVHFRNEDGTPINPKFPNRDSIFMYAAEMIPKLKSRTNPQSAKAQESGGGQAGGKKKGKKK